MSAPQRADSRYGRRGKTWSTPKLDEKLYLDVYAPQPKKAAKRK